MLSQLNLPISSDELMKKLDADGNGTISFDEFREGFGVMLQQKHEQQSAEKQQVCNFCSCRQFGRK